jgi:hypothetical protein
MSRRDLIPRCPADPEPASLRPRSEKTRGQIVSPILGSSEWLLLRCSTVRVQLKSGRTEHAPSFSEGATALAGCDPIAFDRFLTPCFAPVKLLDCHVNPPAHRYNQKGSPCAQKPAIN